MPLTVASQPHHQRSQISAERLARYAQQGRCVKDQLVACKIGGMLLIKLAGFIADERAEILNISPEQVTLQLGRPWHRRIGGRPLERRRPVEVRLQFAEPGEDLSEWQTANARRSVINVQLRPLTRHFCTHDFHRRADAILHLLRLHFVAD